MTTQQSFLKGTAILIFANAISKILGAIFKIPLTYILKEEGMAIFNTAMGVYSTVLTFVVSGIPLALSRMIAEDYALKNYKNLKKTLKVSTLILCVLGLLGSVVMLLFADFFAYSMKDPKAAVAIRAIAPSVFFVAWGNAYKSFYQGCVNMIPTAISQVIEAVVKLVAGFLAALILKEALIEITSAGAISGITIGEIIATAILFSLSIPSVRSMESCGRKSSTKSICISLASIAIPMLVCSCISGSVNLLDVATIRNGLLKITFDEKSAEAFLLRYSSYTTAFDNLLENFKLSTDGARWLYGAYSGFALTLFHLPTGIIGALGTGVLPVISGALAKKDMHLVEKTTSLALKITLIISLPSAFVLGLFSEPLLALLFNNTSSSLLLRELSPCLVFLCVSHLMTVILHAAGKIIEPFVYDMAGMAIKLIFNLLLIPNPYFNISAAPLGSCVAFFVIMALDIFSIKRNLKISLNIKESVIKPFAASVIMAAVMLLVYTPFLIIFNKELYAVTATLFLGAVVYLLSLLSFGAISKSDFQSAKTYQNG